MYLKEIVIKKLERILVWWSHTISVCNKCPVYSSIYLHFREDWACYSNYFLCEVDVNKNVGHPISK